MKKPTRRESFAAFKRDFCDLCSDWKGAPSPKDTIGDGAAFIFQTCHGQLCASIHAPTEGGWKDARSFAFTVGSIYLRFNPYIGPADGPPVGGDFNRFSHKWNIHYFSDPRFFGVRSRDAANASNAALAELARRLSSIQP